MSVMEQRQPLLPRPGEPIDPADLPAGASVVAAVQVQPDGVTVVSLVHHTRQRYDVRLGELPVEPASDAAQRPIAVRIGWDGQRWEAVEMRPGPGGVRPAPISLPVALGLARAGVHTTMHRASG